MHQADFAGNIFVLQFWLSTAVLPDEFSMDMMNVSGPDTKCVVSATAYKTTAKKSSVN